MRKLASILGLAGSLVGAKVACGAEVPSLSDASLSVGLSNAPLTHSSEVRKVGTQSTHPVSQVNTTPQKGAPLYQRAAIQHVLEELSANARYKSDGSTNAPTDNLPRYPVQRAPLSLRLPEKGAVIMARLSRLDPQEAKVFASVKGGATNSIWLQLVYAELLLKYSKSLVGEMPSQNGRNPGLSSRHSSEVRMIGIRIEGMEPGVPDAIALKVMERQQKILEGVLGQEIKEKTAAINSDILRKPLNSEEARIIAEELWMLSLSVDVVGGMVLRPLFAGQDALIAEGSPILLENLLSEPFDRASNSFINAVRMGPPIFDLNSNAGTR